MKKLVFSDFLILGFCLVYTRSITESMHGFFHGNSELSYMSCGNCSQQHIHSWFRFPFQAHEKVANAVLLKLTHSCRETLLPVSFLVPRTRTLVSIFEWTQLIRRTVGDDPQKPIHPIKSKIYVFFITKSFIFFATKVMTRIRNKILETKQVKKNRMKRLQIQLSQQAQQLHHRMQLQR